MIYTESCYCYITITLRSDKWSTKLYIGEFLFQGMNYIYELLYVYLF